MYSLNKEETQRSSMKLLQTAIDKISNLLKRPKTYMSFLNEEEFDELLELMIHWYNNNDSLDKLLKRRNKSFLSLIQKLRKKSLEKLPPKLYRGVHWETKKDYESFVKDLEKGKYSKNDFDSHSSWTTSKRVAKKFLPSGTYGKAWGSKYGVLMEINPKYFKDDIVFSTAALFKSQNDINIFLRLILDKQYKTGKKALRLKKPNIKDIQHSVDYTQGSLYSVEEKEYVLKDPTKNVDKIKYTVEEK